LTVAAGLRHGQSGPRHLARSRPPGRRLHRQGGCALPRSPPPGCRWRICRSVGDPPGWYHPGRAGSFSPRCQGARPFRRAASCGAGAFRAQRAGRRLRGIPRCCAAARKAGRSRPPLKLSPFQPVERDFVLLVPTDLPAESLLRAARAADKKADRRDPPVRRLGGRRPAGRPQVTRHHGRAAARGGDVDRRADRGVLAKARRPGRQGDRRGAAPLELRNRCSAVDLPVAIARRLRPFRAADLARRGRFRKTADSQSACRALSARRRILAAMLVVSAMSSIWHLTSGLPSRANYAIERRVCRDWLHRCGMGLASGE